MATLNMITAATSSRLFIAVVKARQDDDEENFAIVEFEKWSSQIATGPAPWSMA